MTSTDGRFSAGAFLSVVALSTGSGPIMAQPTEPTTQAWESNGLQYPSLSSLMTIPQESPFVPPAGMNLPDSCDLSSYFPPAGNQYRQSACTGWALGYAMTTFQQNVKHDRVMPSKIGPVNVQQVYSPAFVFDMTMQQFEKGRDCRQGTQLVKAITVACDLGCCTWAELPYDTLHTGCVDSVPMSAIDSAATMRMFGPVRLESDDAIQWKYHLSRGFPIVVGLSYDTAFSRGGRRAAKLGVDFTWVPLPASDSAQLWGHALVCTGYNDVDSNFTVLSSWGTNWGMQGYAYIPYKVMAKYCYEAYIVNDDAPSGITQLPAMPADRKAYTGPELKENFKLGKYQRFNEIRLRLMHITTDRSQIVVEFDSDDGTEEVQTMTFLMDQPRTFFHKGSKWTFMYTSAGWLLPAARSKVRFVVHKEDDDHDAHIEEILERSRRLARGMP